MSEENVSVVKNAYASFQKNDMAELIGAMAPDIDWALPGDRAQFPAFGSWQGQAGVRGFFKAVADNLDFHDFSPREFCDCGDKIFVLGHYEATVRKTGRRAASDWVHVFTVRNGKVVRFREFTDTAAFADAWRD